MDTDRMKFLDRISNYSDFILPDEIEESNNKDKFFMTTIGVAVIVLVLFGILTNIFVLILSLFHVKGDFVNFVANLAVVDIVCGLVFAFMGYINVENNKKFFSFGVMTYSAFAFYGSFGVMVYALVPISLSRVIALTNFHLFNWIFSGKRSLALCVLFDMTPIALLLMIMTANQVHAFWLYFTYAGLTVLAYFVAFMSNYVVFRIVARHIRVVRNLRDQVRLLETRQVALATFAQAIVPLFCQVPAFLTLSSIMLLTEPITNGTVIAITQIGLAANPLLDSLITITVIKQYRIEAVTWFSSLAGSSCMTRKSKTSYDEAKPVLETNL